MSALGQRIGRRISKIVLVDNDPDGSALEVLRGLLPGRADAHRHRP